MSFFKSFGPRAAVKSALAASVFVASMAASAQSIVVASTTSTEQSGLFSHLLPEFKKASGIDVKVVALGTGQALDTGRRGDADVVFVHDQKAEDKFVADGFGVKRYPVMYNDFILIGPKADPAGVKGTDIVEGLKKLAAGNAPFVSRGDKSGTHAAELRYWDQAGLKDAKGSGYKECGCGMGPALNMAASTGAYVLADRGTWLNFKNRADLAILVEGDKQLFNQYSVIVVDPSRAQGLETDLAERYSAWMASARGQKLVAEFKMMGRQLFFPNAKAQ